MQKCINFSVFIVFLLLINIYCVKVKNNNYSYVINKISNCKHKYKRKIIRKYAKKKKTKDDYEEYYKELDKIFNECDYDEKQLEEEEKKREEELNSLSEKDLLDINFCNYENDPRSLANLVKDKSKEEIEKEKLEEEEKIKNNEKLTMQYSYDYDRVLKKKFLEEKIEYKKKFTLREKEENLVENVDINLMNDFLNNYKNDFPRSFYKGKRDKYFGREDLVNDGDNEKIDSEENKEIHIDKTNKEDNINDEMLKENLESINFLKKIKNDFYIDRDNYINESVKEIKKEFNDNANTEYVNSYPNTNYDEHEKLEKNKEFDEFVKEKIKNSATDDNINKVIITKYIHMFQVDDEIKEINEKIKKGENVSTILDIFKESKRINMINIMYAFMYIDRFKTLNINEYLYDKRFAHLTYALEELLKYYLYVLNEKKNINVNRRTLILNDKNIIFLIKYMNRLKLFYINLNIYNLLILILSKSFHLFNMNSFIILLAYLNEYTYFSNNIHKKINISLLQHIFNYFKTYTVHSSNINFYHFKILLPLLIKYKYIDNDTFKMIFNYFQKDINKILEFLKDENIPEQKEISDLLFYDVKTKEQKQNKENYISYIKYTNMMKKKEYLNFLSQLLHYLMISKFNERDEIVLKIINIFINHFNFFDLEELLNILYNYDLFKNSNIDIMICCKQELLSKKSMLKDNEINKILSFFIYNYRKGIIFENYYSNFFRNKKYTILRTNNNDKNSLFLYKNINKIHYKNFEQVGKYMINQYGNNNIISNTNETMNSYNDNEYSNKIKEIKYDLDNEKHMNITNIGNYNNSNKNLKSKFIDSEKEQKEQKEEDIKTFLNEKENIQDSYKNTDNKLKEGNNDIINEVLKKKKNIKLFKQNSILNKLIFKDSEFIYDLTHDIHIYVNFRNVHLLKFVYNLYLLSLLFYKNPDVIRIVSEIAYNLIDTNIFSFIDQYSYYLYEDIYVVIKAFKYISFFTIDLIFIWKKFFFLLHHFINSLNLENIYDIFFFIKIANITNLKNENYDVIKLLTSRMKQILEILHKCNIKKFNTYPHTYVLNIVNLIKEDNNENVKEFINFFFYSIYKKIEELSLKTNFSTYEENIVSKIYENKNEEEDKNGKDKNKIEGKEEEEEEDKNGKDENKIEGKEEEEEEEDDKNRKNKNKIEDKQEDKIVNESIYENFEKLKNQSNLSPKSNFYKCDEVYKKVNNYIYNFKDIRIFLRIFLKNYKENQELFNLQIIDFILWNSEMFFLEMHKNKYYYHNVYIFGKEMNEFLYLLKTAIKNNLYNRNIMHRYIKIFKYIIDIQSIHNDTHNLKNNIYKNFFSNFSYLSDINVWKYIRRKFEVIT
ncbi:conserved Plasmodium protein, unknown function [Plasmodium gallinaceum]|uniref:Uncharacterized protein n=1 Tax=Plasmodium gallinaceum TaxID=5849 RepID=A0A1J1GZM7_PLAGA|nr:conserved Plasmodium protein, unknown function [Plasmodium gallinaceum]CRG96753.1 conserved Plasmodium protein, unknown function [Plasmodium gallinaceum]